jgi:hypothetical protein
MDKCDEIKGVHIWPVTAEETDVDVLSLPPSRRCQCGQVTLADVALSSTSPIPD